MASSKIGAPVTPLRTARPLRESPSSTAGLENFTKGRVSSLSQRFTVNEPPSVMRRWVTALLSTPIPISTGSIDSWVIQLVVMPLRSPFAAEPTSASAFGIFQVTRLASSSSRAIPGA